MKKSTKLTAALLSAMMAFGTLTAVPFAVGAAETTSETVQELYREEADAVSGDYKYKFLDDGTVKITEYTGAGVNLTIPSTLDGYTVTSIGTDAFTMCDTLVSIAIPDSVMSICDYAFSGCGSLTSVTIPDSVTSIGFAAFGGCGSLTSITIPDSVVSIGDHAFSCESLTNIEVAGDNDTYSSENGVLFNKDKTTLISCPLGKMGTYSVPDGVTSIGNAAFEGCNNLTSVNIPNSVVSIGGGAFNRCSNLTSIVIPNGVTSIEDETFENCDSLTSITIPNSVTSIGEGAFEYCDSLTSITIPDSVTSIGDYAFCGCDSLTSITIPDGVTSIGESAFDDCESLTSITISDSVTSIGEYAFAGTPWYENQPDGVVYTGKVAYKYKGDMSENTSIILKDGTKGIAGGAFEYCENLISVAMPDSVTSIGNEAFAACGSLTSITFSDNIESIGCNAFSSTEWIYNQPEGLVYIGKVIYEYNGYMDENTTITLKEGTKGIAGSAFEDCENLAGVTIPDSVTNIGDRAFRFCDSLTSITIPASVEIIGEEALGYAYGDYLEAQKMESFTIYGYTGSAAETYANDNDFTFVALDGTTEPTTPDNPVDDVKLGDVNGDGTIDISDATEIQKAVAKITTFTDAQKTAADVNGDGTVDITDATEVQKFVAKIIAEF